MRRADNLTTLMCRLSWNLETSPFWKPQGLSRPVMGLLHLYLYLKGQKKIYIYVLVISTGDVYWWCLLVMSTGDIYWWYLLVISTDDVYWWCLLVMSTGDVYRWYLLVMSTGDVYWWCLQVMSTGDVYWWCLQVMSTGDVYRWYLLVMSTGDVYWWCLLVMSTGDVYWWCLLTAQSQVDVYLSPEYKYKTAALPPPPSTNALHASSCVLYGSQSKQHYFPIQH